MSSSFISDLVDRIAFVPDSHLGAVGPLLKRYQPHAGTISRLLYDKLPRPDRERFVQWFLKRWADIDTVNPIEMHRYRQVTRVVEQQTREPVLVNGRRYGLLDLNVQGYDMQLAAYDWVLGIHDVYFDQYEHGDFRVRSGDVIIDAGGFIGDTAALFHHKTQGRCEVHSFEILDENIELLAFNNERLGIADKVVINKFALSDKTGETVGVNAAVLQGGTMVSAAAGSAQQVPTIRIDDYVTAMNLPKVDLIKMDIEGSEMPALRGALDTIRHFRPRLALSIYHKADDVITIPSFIASTGVGYDFRFKWVHLMQGWEAVLLATPID